MRSRCVCVRECVYVDKYFTYWVISPAKTSNFVFFKLNVYGWMSRIITIYFKNDLILLYTLCRLEMGVYTQVPQSQESKILSSWNSRWSGAYNVVLGTELGVFVRALYAVKC